MISDSKTSLRGQGQGGGKQHSKKAKKKRGKGKKSKEDMLQKLGTAPSILIPLSPTFGSKKNSSTATKIKAISKKSALDVPSVLLPTNYLRDNPNWNVGNTAKILLQTRKTTSGKLSVLMERPPRIRSRSPPYFLATTERTREVFRLARGSLGEAHCAWDEGAKVGPALTNDDVAAKKAKAAEKKRRQRARQKERKAAEKAEEESLEAKKKEEEEKVKEEEDAKRVRDGLKPKATKATNVCDFCQKVARGKRRTQMYQRLNYAYCSTDCVKRHQRELMAAAAAARMEGQGYDYKP